MEVLDKRLVSVFEKITHRIGEKQTLSLRKLSNERKEEIQFGRFIANNKMTVSLLEKQLCLPSFGPSSHCLLLEDTSQIGFSLQRKIKDVGKVDKGQIGGFYLHPVLALDATSYGCHGIASLEFITRPWENENLPDPPTSTLRNKTPFEEKEGFRWLSSIEKALPACAAIATKTVIADREADIYPLLTGLKEVLGVEYVIRSRFDRSTQNGATLREAVQTWSEQACYHIKVPATDQRSAHTANMVIKYGAVVLKKPKGKSLQPQPLHHHCYVVEVKELPESVVNQEAAIHWLLLTFHPVTDPERALQVVEWYKQRWNIEQVFSTLKSKGLKIESSQLDTYEKLQKITLLALMAAVKVIQLLRAREGNTEQSIAAAFLPEEQACIAVLNKQVEGKTKKSSCAR